MQLRTDPIYIEGQNLRRVLEHFIRRVPAFEKNGAPNFGLRYSDGRRTGIEKIYRDQRADRITAIGHTAICSSENRTESGKQSDL